MRRSQAEKEDLDCGLLALVRSEIQTEEGGGKVLGQQSGLLFCQVMPIKLSAPSDGIDLAMSLQVGGVGGLNPHCFY